MRRLVTSCAPSTSCGINGLDFHGTLAHAKKVATIQVEESVDFVYFRCEGLLTEHDIISTVGEHYPTLRNRNKLVDVRQAQISHLDPENLANVARRVSKFQPEDGLPKTALVASDFVAYSILSRYIVLAFQHHVHAEYRVFADLDQAHAWLHIAS